MCPVCKLEAISLGKKSRCLILVQLTVCAAAAALLSTVPVLQYDGCRVPLEPVLEEHMCAVSRRWVIDVTLRTNTGSPL